MWPHPSGVVACDPYFGNVVLLDGFNGINGATATTDESPSAHGSATFHGVAQLSTTQAKFGTSSLFLGSGSLGYITWPDSNDWYFDGGNFTIEFWLYPLSYGSANAFLIDQWGGGQNAWVLWWNVNQLSWNTAVAVTDNNFDIAAPASTPSLNAWHHIAIDSDGTKVRLYADGVMIASTTTVRNLANSTSLLAIGSDPVGTYISQGYMDELRITKGVARYASDSGFAVPTAAFPRVQCPDPHFAQVVLLMGFEDVNGSTGAPGMTDESSHAHGVATDNGNAAISTAQFKFGTSSLGLNTNPALIKYLDSPDWQLAASNTDQYTIECWVRLSTFTLDSYVLSQTSVGNRAFYLILRHTTGDLEYGFSSDGTNWNVYASTSLGLTTGNWYFLTVDKDATGKVRVYSNGVMVASGTPANSAMFNSTIELDIGALAGNNGIVGWMDELRITKGTARYANDAGFAVPTARFPRS